MIEADVRAVRVTAFVPLVQLGLAVVVVGHVVLSARILAAGFGADIDTWLMLGTWDGVKMFGVYSPSRYQGSPIAELSIGTLAGVGGHWLSGFGSVALGAVSVGSLFRLIESRTGRSRDAVLLVAVLAATPLFIIAATTSHDYVYGLAFFLAGWAAQERHRSSALVVVLFGLATASRPTYLLSALVVIAIGRPFDRPARRRIQCVLALGAVAALAYVPAYVSAHGSLGFLDADRPQEQGMVGLLARALLKPTEVLGLLGSALFAGMVVVAVTAARRVGRPAGGERWLLALVAVNVATWLWLPVEPSYLLPLLAVLLVWLARPQVLIEARSWLWALLGAVVLLAWVNPQVLAFSYKNRAPGDCARVEAVGASWSPRLDAGELVEYPDLVREALACNESVRRAKAREGASEPS